MKSALKRIISAICVLCLMASLVTAFADSDKPLHEKYGYQENFEYENEMIGHVLKASVPKILTFYDATIEYKNVVIDYDRFVEGTYTWLDHFMNDVEKMESFVNPETGEVDEDLIMQDLLNYIKVNLNSYLVFTQETNVAEIQGAWQGSGVVISEDGYIATNAHVTSVDDESKLQLYLSQIQEAAYSDLENIVAPLSELNITFEQEELQQLYELLLSEMAQKARVIDDKITYKVCFPDDEGSTHFDDAIKYDATLEEEGVCASGDIDSLTQDTAILKVNVDGLIALKLSESYPQTNSDITTAGYPAAADEIFQSHESNESVLSVSVENGSVKRLIDIKDTDYKAIEIGTTISGGNSGGPSVDKKLEVEGLNTYGLSADMRFAYMVPAEFVSDLCDDIELERGDVTLAFLTGIQMLQQDYGISALECFEYVEEQQPDTPYIDNLIELAKDAEQNEYLTEEDEDSKDEADEKDKEDEADEEETENGLDRNVIIIICAAGAAVIVLVVVVIIILSVKSKKKKAKKEE